MVSYSASQGLLGGADNQPETLLSSLALFESRLTWRWLSTGAA